jgi:hypothetical protein
VLNSRPYPSIASNHILPDGSLLHPGSDQRVQVGPDPSTKATGNFKSGRTKTVTPHRLTEGGGEWQRNWRWEAKEVRVREEGGRDWPRHLSDHGKVGETSTTYGSLEADVEVLHADTAQWPGGKRSSMTGQSKSTN